MEQSQITTLVAEILEIDPSEVSIDSTLEDLEWDSLSDINFIAEVDQNFGKVIAPDALKACKTVGDLQALV